MIQRIAQRAGTALVSALMLVFSGCGGYGSSSYSMSSAGLVSNITISPTTASIIVNGTQQYTAVAKDANGNTVSGVAYTWASSNPSVATINTAGLATGMAAGTTTITAAVSYGGSGGGCTGPYCTPGTGMVTTITSNKATLNVTTMAMATGTVAIGMPLAGALVSLKDAHDQMAVAMTDAGGRYLIATSGLSAPFLLKAEDNQGRVLYGFGTGAGVINITPMTDLMVRMWYGARGTNAAAAFANPDRHPAPGARALTLLNKTLVALLADSLSSQGLDAAKFDLVATPFTADGTGFDRILDNTSVTSMSNGQIVVHDGLADSEALLSFDQAKDAVVMMVASHVHTHADISSATLILQ
ncbi:MAG: Ig-like domain-containing protein [Gammaproteobacteria bacterium]|nr:Ig-like domain-containing protein [Gammaproteobacteria bacterium]